MCYTDRVTPLRKFEHHHFRVEVPSRQNDPSLSVSLYTSISVTGPMFQEVSEVAQSCPTLCDLMDCSPPGSSVLGISQARILEWVAISSSRRSSDTEVELGSPALQVDSVPQSHIYACSKTIQI